MAALPTAAELDAVLEQRRADEAAAVEAARQAEAAAVEEAERARLEARVADEAREEAARQAIEGDVEAAMIEFAGVVDTANTELVDAFDALRAAFATADAAIGAYRDRINGFCAAMAGRGFRVDPSTLQHRSGARVLAVPFELLELRAPVGLGRVADWVGLRTAERDEQMLVARQLVHAGAETRARQRVMTEAAVAAKATIKRF